MAGLICQLLFLSTLSTFGLSQTVQKEYTFTEEQPSNTYIGNLMIDLGINLKIPPEFHQNVKFQFLQQSLEYKDYFDIQDGIGLFRTKKILDRDSMCPMNDICDITLDISISPHEYFEIFKIIIHLEDINDNLPIFPVDTKSLYISETTSTGASFAIPAATDKDSSKYGIQRYLLDTTVNNFELDVGSSGGGGASLSDPRLVLKHALDREKNAFYSIKVLAVDGGVPAETGTITVEITVTDANDNPPRFDNTTYQITIDENTSVDTTILQIHAQDTDVGDNGQVIYTFSQATATTFGHLFSLDSRSGSIIVKGLIDYDTPASMHQFTLSVVASDSGQNSLSDYATVTIFVKDINDNKPKIVLNTAGDNNSVEISENAAIESFVTHISVIDPDQGKSGEVICHLDHAYFKLVSLPYDKQYKLITANTLDREIQDRYHVSITCQDGGTPNPLSSTQHIKVVVTDENDHPPVFQQVVYPVAIRENNQINLQISQVKASDGDINDNARISYSIIEPNDQILSIDETKGFIRTKRVFDYEYKKFYNITVVATDNGNPQQSANATVSLTILDSNDEPPRFNQSHYTFGTLENQHAGTEIGVIEATDLDSKPYNDIVYTIDIHSPDAGVFKIPDPKQGKITLRKVLNREDQDKYNILVIASNPGYSLHTSANVTIFVGDENDNPPRLEFPSQTNNSIQVSSYAEKGELVTRILAHDDDVGRNSYLHYSILAGNIHSVFMMNPNTGEIFINKSLEPYKDKDIKLSILIKDKGDPPLSKVTELQIFVNSSQSLVLPSPVSKSTTNIQLIIILCLSLLVISLFLAVLIVLVTMKRKKKSKQQENRYKLDISFAPVTANGVTGSVPNSITNSPAPERKDETDTNANHSRSFEVMGQPPPYSETGIYPNMNHVNPNSQRPDTRKVHFLETDSAYDSLDKENEENGENAPYLQLSVANRGGRPTFMEQQRQRLLYRSPNGSPAKSTDELHVQNHGDIESDQGSSIDSGRGPSEDEHGRLNTSLPGSYISFMPDPHSRPNNKKVKNTNQRSYPDLVNCICVSSNSKQLYEKQQNQVHNKGCPQHHSPTHDSGSKIDNLHDFQNLLGLPPKKYNKQQGSSKNRNLKVPGGQYSEGSVSSSPHSNTSRQYKSKNLPSNNLDSSYSSNPPHSPKGTNNFTQQCYDDITKQKSSQYIGNEVPKQQTNSHHRKQRDSWRNGEESDCESDGGSTTTSGSFSVQGSVEHVAPTLKPVQKLHQVYV